MMAMHRSRLLRILLDRAPGPSSRQKSASLLEAPVFAHAWERFFAPFQRSSSLLPCFTVQPSAIQSTAKRKSAASFLPQIRLFSVLFLLSRTLVPAQATGIGCFVCSSFNGSNPQCEDTFNSSVSKGAKGNIANYQFPCWAFKKNRQGLFPADHCIKVNGYRSDDPTHTIVIRTCALDSGTLTADTEIVRISHCGHFKYEGHQFTGCVQACDTDGCNGGGRAHAPSALPLLLMLLLTPLTTPSLYRFAWI